MRYSLYLPPWTISSILFAADITDEVRGSIVEARLLVNRYDKESKTYYPQDGEEVSLLDLALQRYTSILLRQGNYVLNGDPSHAVEFSVYVADGAKARLTLNDISIKSISEPAVRLGDHSQLELILRGKNTLDKEGILVPASACLTVLGEGDLRINNTRNYAVGIGSGYNDPYGTIRLESTGTITIRASGEKILCLGGGWSAGEGIRVSGGTLDLGCNGVSLACLGSYSGTADIDLRGATVSLQGDGREVLLMGARSGAAKIHAEDCVIKLAAGCELLTGLGTMNGSASAEISGCTIETDTRCDHGIVIGSFNGDASVTFRDSGLRLYTEGYRVAGFGSLNGSGAVRVESGWVDAKMLAVERLLLGNENSRFVVTGGNIRLFGENDQRPVSPAGTPLALASPAGDHFEEVFRDGGEEWTYRADRGADGYLGVWIPQ